MTQWVELLHPHLRYPIEIPFPAYSGMSNQIAYEAMLRSGERLTQNSLRENLFEFVEGCTSNRRFLSIGEHL